MTIQKSKCCKASPENVIGEWENDNWDICSSCHSPFEPEDKEECVICKGIPMVSFNLCSVCYEDGYTLVQRKPKDSIVEDLKENLYKECGMNGIYGNDGVNNYDITEKVVAFIEKVRTQALDEQNKKVVQMIEDEWTPKKTYKDYGVNRIGMTLDDHKRNFAREVVTKIKQL